jgi:hypothetical protein
VAPIWKYLSQPKAACATFVGILSIATGMYWLDQLNRKCRQVGLAWLLLLFFMFAVAFTTFYPISLKHSLNRGSDREDALRIELVAIRDHQYPYDARTFLGNPPTPLPGALLLAAPFFAIGHIAWQNLLWLSLFFYFTIRFFRYRATAVLFLAVLLLLSPSNLNDFTSGGDYLTNFFYVAIAIAFFIRSLGSPFYACISAAAFLGLTLSSRGIYLVVLGPLLVLTFQRTTRLRTAILFGVVLVGFAAITLPIFMPHPATQLLRQLSQNSGKLRYIPDALHPQWVLPLLGLIVIGVSPFVRMDIGRLFLIFSLSSFVMLAPPIAMLTIHMGKLPYECSYFAVSVLSFSLWALSRYERISLAKHNPPI